ncbi:ATP-binding protein [Actinomadura sp. 9N215]|uniref:ATP-binding protein n=1 Tax=Actinomadura sp. 9N215 TaxID=3375150 RepID=UPI0037994CE1
MLLVGAVAVWPLAGDAQAIGAVCCVAASCLVLSAEIRRERAVSRVRRDHAAKEAALQRRLAAQEKESLLLATELLPAAMERLQKGALAGEALSGLSHDPRFSRELGAAHEAVLSSVIDAVEAQESLRDSAQRAFVNIARRVQAIVHQQAADLREMQDKHGGNPDVFGDLLHVDHGTALIGRLADSIAVLGGARPGRQWLQNVPLFNVCRGAMSRITDYKRVDLHSVAEFAIVGAAVEPLIHALAELLDNATRYSPPQTRVYLTAIEVQSGVAVEIEDAGIGLTEEARARAEEALAQAQAPASANLDLDDLGETPRLGLAVVGRLARMNGFTVALRPSVYGGVRAVLTVPKELITVAPDSGGRIARAATLPPPRSGAAGLTGPSKAVGMDAQAGEFSRNANGLPQRQSRRRAPAPAGAQPTGTPPARAPRRSEQPATPPEGSAAAPVEPGMWLAAFQDGISGNSSAGDAESPKSDTSLGKDE